MPGFSNFFALNQNNSTTTTATDDMSSYYFKPFYFKRGTNGVGEEPTIFSFTPNTHHYVELLYFLHLASSSGPPNGLLFKTTLGFRNDGTLVSRNSIELLSSSYQSPSLYSAVSDGVVNNIKVIPASLSNSNPIIKAFLPSNNVTIQGIYQYI